MSGPAESFAALTYEFSGRAVSPGSPLGVGRLAVDVELKLEERDALIISGAEFGAEVEVAPAAMSSGPVPEPSRQRALSSPAEHQASAARSPTRSRPRARSSQSSTAPT